MVWIRELKIDPNGRYERRSSFNCGLEMARRSRIVHLLVLPLGKHLCVLLPSLSFEFANRLFNEEADIWSKALPTIPQNSSLTLLLNCSK